MPEHEVDWSALSDHALAVVMAVELPLSEGARLEDAALGSAATGTRWSGGGRSCALSSTMLSSTPAYRMRHEQRKP